MCQHFNLTRPCRYLQFHPLVYMMKLHIEMNIASLIAKVVRATTGGHSEGLGENKSSSFSQGTELKSTGKRRATNLFSSSNHRRLEGESATRSKNGRVLGLSGHHEFSVGAGEGPREQDFAADGQERRIKKVTETTVTVSHANNRRDEDAQSESSTSYLKQDEFDSAV